ncbi:hypothetical protein ZWY2020_040024 [Hordeum vulgare]|nr:hypothetical protein ZWY2020_040024 [Hordeum vulgare]
MSALAAATTPDSSSAIVNFVLELTACDADIEAFDIGANGVAALTPTRCSTDCLNDNFNQGMDTTGIRIDMRSPKNYGPVSQSTDTVTAEVSDDYEQHHVSLDKITVTAKRSLNLIEEEGVAKRAHNQDVVT